MKFLAHFISKSIHQPLLVRTWFSAEVSFDIPDFDTELDHHLAIGAVNFPDSHRVGIYIDGAFSYSAARSVYCFVSSDPAILTTCHISQLSHHQRWSIRPLWRVQILLHLFQRLVPALP